MRRVLRPGGRLLFIEHVAAPSPGPVLTLQRLLDPLQQLLADGCHLARDTLAAVAAAGFDVGGGSGDGLRFEVEGLGILAPHAAGVVGVNAAQQNVAQA